jgi:malate synthase
VRVGVQYLESWLRGSGCVPLYNLMEDAATAEISRSQLWQWLKHEALVDGEPMTEVVFSSAFEEEMVSLRETLGPDRFDTGEFLMAGELFKRLCVSPSFDEFLTLPAYDVLLGARQ